MSAKAERALSPTREMCAMRPWGLIQRHSAYPTTAITAARVEGLRWSTLLRLSPHTYDSPTC